MTEERNATHSRDLIRDTVLIEQYDGNLEKMNKELSFKTAYNQTYGFFLVPTFQVGMHTQVKGIDKCDS